jgi:catechol 2,3-dioxygenase-like lactoylglutathione lyase family enzyme
VLRKAPESRQRDDGVMKIELNHTIVAASDQRATADFLTDILGLPQAEKAPPFLGVHLTNDAVLYVMDASRVHAQHYAFLVGDEEFDAIHARITERGLTFYADPFQKQPGEINHDDDGRGLYWLAPDGHVLEMITRPYGG